MCSQPIEHEAQLSRAMPRASARSSAARRGASSNVAAWKLRVGSVAIALNASRLASVPSSRYFAVAGPNERVRRSRAASSTARGSCDGTLVAGLTATALSSLAPSTAPSPPRPAWRPSWETVAYLTRFSPAGPIDATRQALPSRSRSFVSASSAGRPHRSPAGPSRGPSPSISSTEGSAQAPLTTIASCRVGGTPPSPYRVRGCRAGPPASAARVGGQERHRVARRERRLRVARDLVAVERRDDVLVERQAGGGGRLAERRGADHGRVGQAVAEAAQPAEAPDRDLGRGTGAGGLVVVALVEVEDRIEARVERGEGGIAEQRARVEALDARRLEQERGLHAVLGDEPLDPLGERGAVGGRERVAVAADLRQHDVGLVVERLQDGRDEARMQQRDVRRGDVRRLGAVADGVQTGGDALERTA